MKRWLVALLVLLLGRGRRRLPLRGPVDEEPTAAPAPAELLVLALLGLASTAAIAFVVVYIVDWLPAQTQLFGLTLGISFAAIAAAAAVTAKRLVPSELESETYREPREEQAEVEIEEIVREGGSRISRKRLLGLAAGGAGAALGAALVAPAVSLGPLLETDKLGRTPWHEGLGLVDSDGRPLIADDLETKTFYTAFPAGADREKLGSPLVVVRLDPDELELPHDRRDWAPDGIVAYSKICTHAGCAVALYRTPLFAPTSARPALICPCHYSTFDPARAGAVLFGPAGRPLPQLPLAIADGALVARGNFSARIGPSWWGVRQT